MPDEDNSVKENYFGRGSNTVKRVLRALGAPFKYKPVSGEQITILPAANKINKIIPFENVATINDLMIETEYNWEGRGKEEDPDKGIAGLRQELLKKYCATTSDEIDDSMGPFTDREALAIEGSTAESGTGTTKESMIIKKEQSHIPVDFSIPKTIPIHYFDGRARNDLGIAYEIAFVGTANDGYWEELNKEVGVMCDSVLDYYSELKIDAAKLKNVRENLAAVKKEAGVRLGAAHRYIREVEERHRAKLTGGGGVDQFYNNYEVELSDITEKKLNQDQIFFTHTYYIIQPCISVDIKVTRKRPVSYIEFRNKLNEEIGSRELPYQDLVDIQLQILDEEIDEPEEKAKLAIYLDPEKDPYKKEIEKMQRELNDLRISDYRDEMLRFQQVINEQEEQIIGGKDKIESSLERIKEEISGFLKRQKQIANVEARFNTFFESFGKNIEMIFHNIDQDNPEGLRDSELFAPLVDFLSSVEVAEDSIRSIVVQILTYINHVKSLPEMQAAESQMREGSKLKSEVELELSKIIVLVVKRKRLDLKIKEYTFYEEQCRTRRPNFEKHPWEVGVGLDENGWPLEVGDGETIFNGNVLQRGEVLLDKYLPLTNSHRKRQVNRVRVAPSDFVSEMDRLQMITHIYVHYDTFRDDLRDGRHHSENAISVMDRIIREINSPYLTGVEKKRDNFKNRNFWSSTDAKKYEMQVKLNKLPAGGRDLRGMPTDPDSVTVPITPTQWNPAFDVKSKGKKGLHRGRIFYYETQNESEQSEAPTMSTRGAAMYILHRAIEEVKYWHGKGDKKREGVIELMDSIGKMTHGFDIGPNTPRWSKKLTRNPFRPAIKCYNQPIHSCMMQFFLKLLLPTELGRKVGELKILILRLRLLKGELGLY